MIARPKISQNDLDLTELESIKHWAGARGSLFDFSTGERPRLRSTILRDPFDRLVSEAHESHVQFCRDGTTPNGPLACERHRGRLEHVAAVSPGLQKGALL